MGYETRVFSESLVTKVNVVSCSCHDQPVGENRLIHCNHGANNLLEHEQKPGRARVAYQEHHRRSRKLGVCTCNWLQIGVPSVY